MLSSRTRSSILSSVIYLAAATITVAQTPEPLKVGFGISLSGPLAAGGKSALLAKKIWEEEINAKGGLLGRPVKLVYYDDQSTPANVPGIFAKLLDVDKVDLIVGGYGTNVVAPAVPVAMQKNKLILGPFALSANEKFEYSKYFAIHPGGPDAKASATKGFFDLAESQSPKPLTLAIVAADAEAARAAADGARENAKKAGLRLVFDRTYPPTTVDFTPIVRSIQATNPDVLLICAYPLDAVGLVRAINEVGLQPKLVGGAMFGLPSPPLKAQLGPLLNGFVNYEFWLPVPSLKNDTAEALIKKYQSRAAAEGVDPIGFYVPPWAYSTMQVLEQAVRATGTTNDDKLAEYIRQADFDTAVGRIKFGKGGEWTQSRILMVQYRGIKDNSVDQFRDTSTQVVVYPPNLASGTLIYPYSDARK